MTPPTSVTDWLRLRDPDVPPAFQPLVRPTCGEQPVSAMALADEARRRLGQVDGATTREGAFHLLAADGFVTWACERALEEQDPARALRALLDALTR